MLFVLIALVVFFGVVVHSMLGFGVALITMSLLLRILSPTEAAAFVAMFTLPLQLVIIWRYHDALTLRPIWHLILSSVIGIPVGVALLSILSEQIILTALALFLIGYALYSLLNLNLPEIRHPGWGFGFGLLSGILSGAYNTGGPPLVIYGTARRWSPEQFKANLQALFTINGVLVLIAHIAAGHVDALVLENALIALPVIAVGAALGFWLSHRVNEALFRKAVLILLLLIGVRLLLP
ncbi:MAG TPA: sulfite exporter TauE/SafE family protein [Phototrophicaceae bacterium]|nr:sulfite exporter TauE/SafE family protein [Phototrophicaceae bacterium]